jgi:hypothetical protein
MDVTPAGGRLEPLLKTVDALKPATTRRGFMQKLLVAGGVATAAAIAFTRIGDVLSSESPVLDFVNAAVCAERIGIAPTATRWRAAPHTRWRSGSRRCNGWRRRRAPRQSSRPRTPQRHFG